MLFGCDSVFIVCDFAAAAAAARFPLQRSAIMFAAYADICFNLGKYTFFDDYSNFHFEHRRRNNHMHTVDPSEIVPCVLASVFASLRLRGACVRAAALANVRAYPRLRSAPSDRREANETALILSSQSECAKIQTYTGSWRRLTIVALSGVDTRAQHRTHHLPSRANFTQRNHSPLIWSVPSSGNLFRAAHPASRPIQVPANPLSEWRNRAQLQALV